MTIKITAIHLEGGQRHEHITRLRWTNPASGEGAVSTKGEIVSFIETKHGKAYVEDRPGNRVEVGVVTPTTGAKYLRTHADGSWTNNLLALPRF